MPCYDTVVRNLGNQELEDIYAHAVSEDKRFLSDLVNQCVSLLMSHLFNIKYPIKYAIQHNLYSYMVMSLSAIAIIIKRELASCFDIDEPYIAEKLLDKKILLDLIEDSLKQCEFSLNTGSSPSTVNSLTDREYDSTQTQSNERRHWHHDSEVVEEDMDSQHDDGFNRMSSLTGENSDRGGSLDSLPNAITLSQREKMLSRNFSYRPPFRIGYHGPRYDDIYPKSTSLDDCLSIRSVISCCHSTDDHSVYNKIHNMEKVKVFHNYKDNQKSILHTDSSSESSHLSIELTDDSDSEIAV